MAGFPTGNEMSDKAENQFSDSTAEHGYGVREHQLWRYITFEVVLPRSL